MTWNYEKAGKTDDPRAAQCVVVRVTLHSGIVMVAKLSMDYPNEYAVVKVEEFIGVVNWSGSQLMQLHKEMGALRLKSLSALVDAAEQRSKELSGNKK